MSAVEELKNISILIIDLFKKSGSHKDQDNDDKNDSDIYLLQYQIEYHIERMIHFLRESQREGYHIGYKFNIDVSTERTPEEARENAFSTLYKLYSYPCFATTKNTYPIRFLQAKLIAHMRNMVALNRKIHSNRVDNDL